MGCSYLPASGPGHRAITIGATASLTAGKKEIAYDYVLVDITSDVINLVESITLGSLYDSFGVRARYSPDLTLGEGDVIQITVFESSTGGLFIPPDAGVRPGNFVTLPPQKIDRSGDISVPYAGRVRASGRTLMQVQSAVERRLSPRAVEPQVVVSLVEQTAVPVTVIGEAASQLQLNPNERILDVIARSGGVRGKPFELFVTLQRRGRNETIHFPRLVRKASENVYAQPGDTIYVHREKQKFVAVGALGAGGQDSGVTGIFDFEEERVSLMEAIAQAGGLLDFRADASSVFIYRTEFRSSLESMGVDLSHFDPDQKLIPTIYRANFLDPSSFFFAQRFPIRHKDAIYVANSDSVELEKFLINTRLITSTIAGVSGDVVATRDNVRALRD